MRALLAELPFNNETAERACGRERKFNFDFVVGLVRPGRCRKCENP
jgi:hypothetical protein